MASVLVFRVQQEAPINYLKDSLLIISLLEGCLQVPIQQAQHR